jgi:hypothetical protein
MRPGGCRTRRGDKTSANRRVRHNPATVGEIVPNEANVRPIPFERGNKLAERDGFYSKVLAAAELDEVDEIATVLRDTHRSTSTR